MTAEIGKADIFISYAHEDQEEVARPLAEALRQRGLTVWYDEYVLQLGDSLRQVIERGLATVQFGVVILSPNFFAKEWPQRELNALLARETSDRCKVLLPVWHNLTVDQIVAYSPILADRLAVSTAKGLPFVVEQILQVLESTKGRSAASVSPPTSTIKGEPASSKVTLSPENDPRGMLRRLRSPAITVILASILIVVTLLLWHPWRSDRSDPAPGEEGMQQRADSVPPAVAKCVSGEERTENGITYVHICPGTFWMGSDKNDTLAHEDEKPAHRVTLSEFWLSQTEITNEQYRGFRSDYQGRPNFPVTGFSWAAAQEACQYFGGRLPTEAEWEYAARAGSQTAWSFGDETKVGKYAWYDSNSSHKVHPVGTLKSNSWGLKDMYGNAWEWVADWYRPTYPAKEAKPDPSGPSTGDARVLRGGSFFSLPRDLRSANRFRELPSVQRHPDIGFRCARGALPRAP